MSDYISREALTEAFENADADVCESFPDGYCDWGFGRKNIRDVIASIPTADAEPVRRGRWNRPYISWFFPLKIRNPYCFCTYCGHPIKPRKATDYCPNCGAKMDLEVENDG